nr:hypothetical protein [Tanacetum cinerariifolium]
MRPSLSRKSSLLINQSASLVMVLPIVYQCIDSLEYLRLPTLSSGMEGIGGDAESGGDGICGMYPGELAVGEAAARSGCSSAEKTSSSGGIYLGYTVQPLWH